MKLLKSRLDRLEEKAERKNKRSILDMSDPELEALMRPLLDHEGEVTDEDLIRIARIQEGESL